MSEITIRRDLNELERAKKLERVHGGARWPQPREPESPVVQRMALQPEEKRAIADLALSLVDDGDVIAIESGSTTIEFAKAVAARPWSSLTVVTNSFPVVNELIALPNVRLVFIGGIAYYEEMGTFGSLAENMLQYMKVGKAFVTCRGIEATAGLTNDPAAEHSFGFERALIRAAQRVIVLADHTKIGRVYLLQSVPIEEIDVLVTTDLASPEALDSFRARGLEVLVAGVRGIPAGQAISAEPMSFRSRTSWP